MAIATAVTGFASGAAKFFEGQSMQNRAQRAIDNFRFSELQNPYRDTRVSTLGAELQARQAAELSATSIDALRSGGTRAVMGGIPQVIAQQQNLNQRIAANIDQQQANIDMAAAGQDVRNQELIREAEARALQGYGQQLNVGMGMEYGGLSNIANAAGLFGQTQTGQGVDNWVSNLFGGNNNQ